MSDINISSPRIVIMRIIKVLPLFGVILFSAILWNMDWERIYQTFLSINPVFIFLAILLQIPIIGMKATKWKLLMRPYSVSFPLPKAFIAWLVGFSAGIITPGRMGDLIRSYYLREKLPLGITRK